VKKKAVDPKILTWHTEQRRIGDLVEWEKNPRLLTQKEAHDLACSLENFGYVETVVLNHDGKSIIGGHQRRRIMLAEAMVNPDAMIDVRMPSRQLSVKEAEELAIRLNRNTGQWDYDKLANEFEVEELITWGFDAAELGIDLSEEEPEPEKTGGSDESSESDIHVKPGESWCIGTNGSKITVAVHEGAPGVLSIIDAILSHAKKVGLQIVKVNG